MVVQEDCFSSWAALKFDAVFYSETLKRLYWSTQLLIREGGEL